MIRLAAPLAVLAALSLACGPSQPPGPIGPSNCGAPPAADGGSVSALVSANGQFAVDLFGQLAAEADGGNVVASPFSVSAAFGMVYAGAAGTTADQIGQVFHFPAAADLAPAFGALDCQLEGDAAGPDGGQLDIANRLFAQKTLPLQPAFLSLLQDDYGAPLQTVDFESDPNGALQSIDGWVSQNTAGMIPQLLQPGDVDSSTLLVLADALYFHGLWEAPFDPATTSPGPFQVSAQQSVQVPMMGADVAGASYYRGSGFALLELPYQSHTAMDIVLPDAVDGLPQLEAQLTAQSLQSWLGQLAIPPGGGAIAVQLPRFDLDVRTVLNQPLQALGLTAPFHGADFSGIDGAHDLSISKVVHEAVLKVTEAGTEAAAATAVVMTGALPAPPSTTFDANHPFLLLIRDLPTGEILFVGQVTNPAAQG